MRKTGRLIASNMVSYGGEGGSIMAKYYDENSRKSAQKYMIKNSYSIAFRLSKIYEKDLIEIYHSIPSSQKAAWFKECLRKYGEEHPVEKESE